MRLLYVLLLANAVSVHCLFNIYPKIKLGPIEGDDYGDPLFLTPYIESGKIKQGQKASLVPPLIAKIESHAGYLTVNETYNSNMFFWYFKAEKKPDNAPVVVWLQGGPGASSLYGLFEENGPFYLNKKQILTRRKHYWSQEFNVVYIDNPVGTGFSFTDDDKGYARDEVAVGRDLYSAVVQFLKLFPKLQDNEFYVSGESYAGKYVPALAYTIHRNNPTADLKVNLQGITIGNGLCAPEYMLGYGEYLYQIGLIDSNAREEFSNKEENVMNLIKQKNFVDAFYAFDKLLNGDLIPPHTSFFYNATRFDYYFNYLHNVDYNPYGDMGTYLQKDVVRKSIHVGNLTFNEENTKVEENLKGDVMQSVQPWVETLLDNYRVLIYNGQLDIIVAYPLTVNFLQHLDWSDAASYKTAQRKPWFVGTELAGYSKTVNGFTELLVRNAGHMVPTDQPLWALEMMKRFTSNKPF